MGSREIVLVYILDEDVMGHIESDHGTYAKVAYAKGGIQYHVNMSSDEYIVTEVIEVDDSDVEEED